MVTVLCWTFIRHKTRLNLITYVINTVVKTGLLIILKAIVVDLVKASEIKWLNVLLEDTIRGGNSNDPCALDLPVTDDNR